MDPSLARWRRAPQVLNILRPLYAGCQRRLRVEGLNGIVQEKRHLGLQHFLQGGRRIGVGNGVLDQRPKGRQAHVFPTGKERRTWRRPQDQLQGGAKLVGMYGVPRKVIARSLDRRGILASCRSSGPRSTKGAGQLRDRRERPRPDLTPPRECPESCAKLERRD